MTWTDLAFFFIIVILVLALCLIFHFIVVRGFGAIERKLNAALNDFVDSFVLRTENEIEKDMKAILSLVQEAIEPNITVDLHRVRRKLWEAYIEISLTDVVTSETSNMKESCTKVLRSTSKIINKCLIKNDCATALREINGIVAKFDYETQHVTRVSRHDFSFADKFKADISDIMKPPEPPQQRPLAITQSSGQETLTSNKELNTLLKRIKNRPYTIYKTKGELRRVVLKVLTNVKDLIQLGEVYDLEKLTYTLPEISHAVFEKMHKPENQAYHDRFHATYVFAVSTFRVVKCFLGDRMKVLAMIGIDNIALNFDEEAGVPLELFQVLEQRLLESV
uniref:uncharacterized protein LOC104265911 n=1 Tax=Ciona intestinalis TaxID=7719 RepID=UPI000521B448|nr:uncharacterized protein LOC104265911 [Ciona intestinalis]|eukprot:XP_009859360.1 uncharacterized protein LOC104265911 [Ciona intestinalis]